jgi:hypothetical protein
MVLHKFDRLLHICTKPPAHARPSEGGLMQMLVAKCGIAGHAGYGWRRDEAQRELKD